MGRASFDTLLPIDTWARLMGFNPWNFNQFGVGFPESSATHSCPFVVFQFAWQQDYLSREEIAEAIQRAEYMLAEQVGYFPAPKYITTEQAVFESRHWPSTYNYWHGFNYLGRWNSVQTRYQKVLGGGSLARTNIADVAVTLSDSDGDGINDTFTTASQATTVTDVDEIGVYFTAADRNNATLDESWRIRPVKVSISGGNVIVTGHSSLLVKPDLTLVTDPLVLDVTTAGNYVTSLTLERIYTDDVTDFSAGTAYWEGWAGDCVEEPCNLEALSVCIGDRIGNMGRVFIGYGVLDECNWRGPDKVSLNYLAGERLVNGQMKDEWAQIVAHLATAMLPTGECGCDRTNKIIAYWREDLSEQGRSSPFGNERGAIWAYNRLQNKEQIVAAVI